MVQASTTFVGTEGMQPIRRLQIPPMSFWTLFAVQAALLMLLLVAVARMVPVDLPLAATPDYDRVREAVMQRASGETVDPLIEFQSGATAPASSVRGFALNGATYYYQITGQPNFDPLSRQLVNPSQVQVVLRDSTGPRVLTIYTITR